MARANYLGPHDSQLLNDWGRNLRATFPGKIGYLVGSALERADYRDVDVRIILDDDRYDDLANLVDPGRLNLMLSLWGRHVTGLPIDCQVQAYTEANTHNGRRHALGLGPVTP